MRLFRFNFLLSRVAAFSGRPWNRFESFTLLVLVAFAALSVCGPEASAQVETGQIAGTVMDQTGAAVPDAAVAIKNLSTNIERNTVSSPTGAYQVLGLEPAIYQVTVSSNSFKSFVGKVEVTVGGKVTLNARLSVSETTTEVQVVGEGGAQVNTETQEMSQVVDTEQLTQLPSLTRNPYDFIALSGNVSAGDNSMNSGTTAIQQTGTGQNQENRGVGYSINGQRESGTEILLDGVENVSVFSQAIGEDVPLDATQEYSVLTSNYSAEFGRASGGVINVTTKAGTNSYHGSAWEFNRLSAYTANTYGNDANNAAFLSGGGTGPLPDPKGIYTRNQFGYAAGGPIKKDKIFIFESTEWDRVRSAATETEEVFDPAFIALMPSNVQAYYKQYGQTTIPSAGTAATVGQVAAAGYTIGSVNGTTPISATTPIFDTVNFKAPFDAGGGIPENTFDLVGRVDYNPTDKTQMFFRGGREGSIQLLGSNSYSAYPQYDTGTTFLNQSYLYSLFHTLSPSVFLSLKASFTRFNENTSFDQSLLETPNLMFVSPHDPVSGQLIQMPGLENYSEPGFGGLPAGGPQNTIQFEPDLSWTKGKHSMRFGFLETYIQLNYASGAYVQAIEQLGSTFQDSLNDMMNTAANPGGAPLTEFETRIDPQGKLPCAFDQSYTDGGFGTLPAADMVPGSPCEIQTPASLASDARSYRYKDWSGYGEDSYKVTPRLTVNAGLRYEHYGVQHDNHPNLDSNFYFGSGSGIEAQVRSGQIEIADKSAAGGFWASRWGTFAPRVGFAYDIFGNGRDSIRGGYGISYERNFGNITYNASFNPPASAVPSVACAAESSSCVATVTNQDLGPLGQSIGPQYLPPVELRHLDQNIEVAQTQFWSFALEHQLVPGALVEIAYVGAKGDHLYDLANVNEQGAGQVYLGDANAIGPNCVGSGLYNNNTLNQLTAAGDPNAQTDASECLTRPNAQFTNVNMRGSGASSAYDGLNLRLQLQNLHHTGLSVTANYTWSHALDELSSTFGDSLQGGSGYIGSLGYTSLLDPKLDWGSADYDIRQRLVLAPIWQTPWFKQGSGIEHQALGGWMLSGIYTARGGAPFSVFDYSNDETFYTVPRLTPATPFYSEAVSKHPKSTGTPNNFDGLDIPLPKSFAPLSDTLGISDYGPFPSGMMRRNSIRGPGAWNVDASLHKTFRITERVGMEFAVDGIDVLNHHNYYANTSSLDYGGATTTPLFVQELKGGLGTLASSGNHDERRFGQFSLRATF